MLCRMFRKHLAESGKTYCEHAGFAIKAGGLLLWAGFASIVHGLLPNLFPFVSRDIVLRLSEASRLPQGSTSETSESRTSPDSVDGLSR